MAAPKGSPLLSSVEALFENTESIVIAAFQVQSPPIPHVYGWHYSAASSLNHPPESRTAAFASSVPCIPAHYL